MNLSQSTIATRSSLLLAGACLQWAAFAAESAGGIWRCGNTYTDRPCHDGRQLDLDDARSARQKLDADQATREARATAERMERDRQQLEAKAQRAVLLDDQALRPRHSQPQEASDAPLHKPKTRKDPHYLSPTDAPAQRKKRAEKN